MTTASEIKESIDKNFASYVAELEQSGDVWESKPEGGSEGEAAWCAREVAEHIAGSGPFFGAGIAQAIGVDGPTPARMAFPTHAEAVSETKRTHGLLMDVVAKVTDEHMGQEVDHPRLGKQTIGSVLGIVSHHLTDHAGQLKTLRGG